MRKPQIALLLAVLLCLAVGCRNQELSVPQEVMQVETPKPSPAATAMPEPTAAKPAAYFSIDINPEMEIGMDQDGKIVHLQAFNEDGEHLFQTVDLLDRQIMDGMDILFSEIIKEGFLSSEKEENLILFSTYGTEEERAASLLEQILEFLNQKNEGQWDSRDPAVPIYHQL